MERRRTAMCSLLRAWGGKGSRSDAQRSQTAGSFFTEPYSSPVACPCSRGRITGQTPEMSAGQFASSAELVVGQRTVAAAAPAQAQAS